MPSTSLRALSALVAMLAGLVSVPGSLSAVGGRTASTADPREVAESYLDKQAEALGCAAFLRKPFRRDALIEAIMAATTAQDRPGQEA